MALFLTAGCATITATSAAAYNTPSDWNVATTPLVVSGYGSTAKAYGHIKIFNGSSGTRMYSYAWNRFTDADNHMAYTDGYTQYNAGTCRTDSSTVSYKGVEVSSSSQCAFQFTDKDGFRNDGLNYTLNAWTAMPDQNFAVNGNADRGRLAVNLSIDIPLRFDPTVGPSYSSADSW